MKRETHERSLETLAEKLDLEAAAAKFNRHNKAEKELYWRGVEDANLKAAGVVRSRIKSSKKEGAKVNAQSQQTEEK